MVCSRTRTVGHVPLPSMPYAPLASMMVISTGCSKHSEAESSYKKRGKGGMRAVRPLPGRWTRNYGPPAPWLLDTPVVRHGRCRSNQHSRAHLHGHRISLYRPSTLYSIPTTLWSTPTTLCTRMGTEFHCTATSGGPLSSVDNGIWHCWQSNAFTMLPRSL